MMIKNQELAKLQAETEDLALRLNDVLVSQNKVRA